MKKRTMMVFVVFLLCSTLVFAAGEKEEKKAEVMEVEFMNWMEQAELEGWETIFESFKEKFPNVEFNLNSIPGGTAYQDKLKVRVMTDDAPEVFQSSVKIYFKTLCKNGFVLPLDERGKNDPDFDFNDYSQKILNAFTVDDQIYALPKDNSVMGLIYNKEMFDENGMEYPNTNWRWDDLKAAAQKLSKDTNNDGNTDVFGFASFRMKQMWLDTLFLIGYGGPGACNYQKGDKLTIDHPENIEAFEYFREMFLEHRSAPDPSSQLNAVELFNAGKLGMMVGATHMLPGLFEGPTDFRVTMTPMNEEGDRAITLLTSGFAVSKNARQLDTAWEVIKYLSYGEGNKILSQSSGSVPATSKYYDVFLTDEMKAIGMETMLNMTEYQYARNYGKNEEEFMQEYQRLIDEVFTTKRPAGELVDKALPGLKKKFEPF
jgi:multiple sugar transport system substrate-binding protein